MKLYTKEQLHNTVIVVSNCLDDINLHVAQEKIKKHLKSLQPIELPSDEEIEEIGHKHQLGGYEWQNEKRKSFIEGAKWMRDKIQGGDN